MLSVLAGIASGWAFYVIWRRLLPRMRSREFWQSVPVHASGLLHSKEPDDVMRHYRALIKQSSGFAARNTFAVAAGLVPMVGAFLLLAAVHLSDRSVPVVEVQPATAVAGIPPSARLPGKDDESLLIIRHAVPASGMRLHGVTLDREALAAKQALCNSWIACIGYELMLFETHSLQGLRPAGVVQTVVVRPRAFHANPFWPHVDDLELAFLASTIAGAATAGWWSGRRRRVAQ